MKNIIKTIRNIFWFTFFLEAIVGYSLDQNTCFSLQDRAKESNVVYFGWFFSIGGCQWKWGVK